MLWVMGQRGWPGAVVDCTATLCFCEASMATGWRQPANSWSNLAPLIAAVAVAIDAARRRGAGPALKLLGFAFPLTLVFQGLGALAFHASLTAWGGVVDASSMFAVVGLLVAINLFRAGKLNAGQLGALWAGISLGGLTLGWVAPEVVSPVMFVFVISVLGTEVWLARHGRTPSPLFFRLGIWIFLSGVAVWFASAIEGTPLCDPASLWQGHAYWHVTSAIAVGLFWVHARRNLEPRRAVPGSHRP